MTPHDAIVAIASKPPCIEVEFRGDFHCAYCNGSANPFDDDAEKFMHRPECPWVVLRQAVAEAGGPPLPAPKVMKKPDNRERYPMGQCDFCNQEKNVRKVGVGALIDMVCFDCVTP